MAKPIHVTTQNFDEAVLNANRPVLVDFWAEWCGPCRMIAPALEQLAAESADTLTVAKVDIDEAEELAVRYGIASIPTLVLFDGGKEVQRASGAMSKAQIAQTFNAHLTAGSKA
jgi:thioredoxin 1